MLLRLPYLIFLKQIIDDIDKRRQRRRQRHQRRQRRQRRIGSPQNGSPPSFGARRVVTELFFAPKQFRKYDRNCLEFFSESVNLGLSLFFSHSRAIRLRSNRLHKTQIFILSLQ